MQVSTLTSPHVSELDAILSQMETLADAMSSLDKEMTDSGDSCGGGGRKDSDDKSTSANDDMTSERSSESVTDTDDMDDDDAFTSQQRKVVKYYADFVNALMNAEACARAADSDDDAMTGQWTDDHRRPSEDEPGSRTNGHDDGTSSDAASNGQRCAIDDHTDDGLQARRSAANIRASRDVSESNSENGRVSTDTASHEWRRSTSVVFGSISKQAQHDPTGHRIVTY